LFNHAPPLEIPLGFFADRMTIRYGWNDIWKHDCFTNINPLFKNMKCVDPNQGIDYKYTIDKLPLFWYGRISDISENPHMNEEEMKKAYENWFYEGLKIPFGAYSMHFDETDHPPIEWFDKNIKQIKMLRHF
jgi:hypothetical protein